MTDPAEAVTDISRCNICFEHLRDPHLCPYCSKLCCFDCFKRWLTSEQSNCPFCRAQLLTHELVYCRWLPELIRHVGKGRGEDAERCPQHNQEELSVYCDTCQACICSKCALFGQHVGHKHLPVDDVYKKHYHLLIADGNRLRKHLLAVASMGKKVDKSVERVRIERKNHEEIMKVALDQIMKRFEKTTNDKMRQLSEVREKLSESSDRIQLFMADLDEKMKTGSKKELVSQSSSLKQKLSHFLQGLDPLPVNDNELSKISSFTNEIVPPYDVKTVKIHNFSTLRRRGEVVYSDPLVVGGLTWRLKVYPDGSNNVKGKYLSVFVELSDGPTKTTRYEYRIEIIWQGSGGGKDVSKDLVREHASDFAVGESWGYNKFYKLDYLLPEGYIHPANDTLHFRFGVRCQTYHQKCRDLMLYVHRLKKEQNSMSRKIQDLEQKLRNEAAKNRLRKTFGEEAFSPLSQQPRTSDSSVRQVVSEDDETVTGSLIPNGVTEEGDPQDFSSQQAHPSELRPESTDSRTPTESPRSRRSLNAAPARRQSDDVTVGSTSNTTSTTSTAITASTSGLSSRHKAKSQSLQDLKMGTSERGLQQWSTIQENSLRDSLPSELTPRATQGSTDVLDTDFTETTHRQQPWEAEVSHRRSQSVDSNTSRPQSRHDVVSPPSMFTMVEERSTSHLYWDQDKPPYHFEESSQSMDMAFMSGLQFSTPSELSQQNRSQSPTQHVLTDLNVHDIRIALVEGPHNLSQDNFTHSQERFWESSQPSQQCQKREIHSQRTTSSRGPKPGTPGLQSSMCSAITEPLHRHPGRSQYSQVEASDTRHTTSHLSVKKHSHHHQRHHHHHHQQKAQHYRSQEKLHAGSRSMSSSSLNGNKHRI